MYCTRNVTEDLVWVGANDRRLAMFEGVYSVPKGVSYNSYLLLDEKTVLFDTVDAAVGTVFFENVEKTLNGRHLDYLVVHHMEPVSRRKDPLQPEACGHDEAVLHFRCGREGPDRERGGCILRRQT